MKVAFAVVLVFFAGLGLGFVAGSRSERAAAPQAAEVAAAPAKAEPTAAAPEEPASVPPASEAEPVPVSLREALAAIPAPLVDTGSGVIRGHVRTEAGDPLDGVQVKAYLVRARGALRSSRASPAEDPDLETRVVEFVTQERRAAATRRQARTGADGAYALEGLADAGYSLQASREGYVIRPAPGQNADGVRPGATVDFMADAIFEVAIQVLLPDGGQPAEAVVHWKREGDRQGEMADHWSPEAPAIKLKAGVYKVWALQGEGGELRSEPQGILIDPAVAITSLTLELKGHPGIRGRVIVPQEERLESVHVHALRIQPGNVPGSKRLKSDGKSTWVHRDFKFAFGDLTPGTYVVGASRGSGRIAVTETVEVLDRMVLRDLVLPPLDPSEYVVLWVLGPDGKVLKDLDIGTGYRIERSSSSGGGTKLPQADGSLFVFHHDNDRDDDDQAADEGTYFINIKSERYGAKEIEYKRSQTSTLTVQFAEPAMLEVTLAGYAGSGLEGRLKLSLESSGASDSTRPRRFRHPGENAVNFEGRQTLGPVEPGEYALGLHLEQKRSSSGPIQRVPVSLRPGKNQVALPLPRLYTLRVLVDNPQGQTSLQLRHARRERGSEWWGTSEKVSKEGMAVFEDLPAGEYKLQLFGAGGPEEMPVSLPAQTEVRFQPRALNALEVSIEDPAGALAKAGFQSGDLIIGIDGKEFENPFQAMAQMTTLLNASEARLTLLRGGARVELKVDPKKLMDPADQGGHIEPTSR